MDKKISSFNVWVVQTTSSNSGYKKRKENAYTPFSYNIAKLADDKSSPSKVSDVNCRLLCQLVHNKTAGLKDYVLQCEEPGLPR